MVKKALKYLVLFDHDGTLCHEDKFETESFKFAFNFAAQRINEPINNDIDIEQLKRDVKGTTERNLVRQYCLLSNIPYSKLEAFESSFYFGRAKWYEAMKSGNEFIWSSYYPDSYYILSKLAKDKKYTTSLITGNPKELIGIKVPGEILNYFIGKNGIKGVFGDQADTREELLEMAIDQAVKLWKGFEVSRDTHGFVENVFYIADSKSDFFAGINSKIKTIWIPSRNHKDCLDLIDDISIKYIINSLKGRALITNDLSSTETLKMLNLTR